MKEEQETSSKKRPPFRRKASDALTLFSSKNGTKVMLTKATSRLGPDPGFLEGAESNRVFEF